MPWDTFKVPDDIIWDPDWNAMVADQKARIHEDGTVPLTGNWDIGAGFAILGDVFQARGASGLGLYEDGGRGILVEDATGYAILSHGLAIGVATLLSGSFAGFVAAESKTLSLTGLKTDNPVVRRVTLFVNNDPGAFLNVLCRLSFYRSDSMTEDERIITFYFNLTYTETNGGAAPGHTTDVVDSVGGLVDADAIRYLGGTAETVRLTAVPNGGTLTLTFTALAYAHANNTGIVRVVELPQAFQTFDLDATLEIHATLEFLSAPPGGTDVYMAVEVQ